MLGDDNLIIDRVANAKRGIVTGFLYKTISILVPFFIQTALIHRLGIQYVGLQGVFSSILSILNVAEFGFGSAIVFCMYEPIAKDDTETLCALLGFYRKVYRIVGAIIFFLGVSLIPFLSFWVDNKAVEVNIYVIYLLFLINTVISYYLYAYRLSILNAFQRTDIISLVGMVSIGITGAFQILIIIFLKNYYFFLCVPIVFNVLNNLSISAITKRMFPNIDCRGTISDGIFSDISKRVKGAFIYKICGITRNAFDSVFISTFFGLSIAGIYSNYYYVMNAVAGVLSIVSVALIGGIGNSIQLETVEKNYNDMIKFNYIYMIISGWFTICLLCLYQPFMSLWAGQASIFPFNTMVLFVFYFYVKQLGNIRAVYSDAAGLFWENRHRAIAESIANLVLNYLAVRIFGVNGIIGATIITLFIFGYIGSAKVIFKYYFKCGMQKYIIYNFRYTLLTSIIAIGVYYLCSLIRMTGLEELVVRAIICIAIPPLLYMIAGLTNYENRDFLRWMCRCLKK